MTEFNFSIHDPNSAILFCLVASVSFSFLSAWFVRIDATADVEAYKLSELETAYLLGGPLRAKELAFFNLLRDGWIKVNRNGYYSSRFHAAPPETQTEMSSLEREMLTAITGTDSVTTDWLKTQDLGGVYAIEHRLVKKRLIIQHEYIGLFNTMSRLPLGLMFLVALKYGVENLIRHEGALVPILAVVTTFIGLKIWDRIFTPRMLAGDRLNEYLQKNIIDRSKTSDKAADGEAPYDRLWTLKDEVMLKGLDSLVGAAVLPTIEHQAAKSLS